MVKGYLTYVVSSEGQQAAADGGGLGPARRALASKATSIIAKISSGS